MNYPICIHKDVASDYGVVVPDLPGCFSAGKSIDEAMEMSKEAIELHIEGLIEEGLPIPRSGTIEDHNRRREFAKGTWAVIAINPADLRLKTRRVNISMPERVLEAVDQYAVKTSETRSGLLVRAVTEYMGRQPVKEK
jgi:predicted RNase H-like HicB family nuclease